MANGLALALVILALAILLAVMVVLRVVLSDRAWKNDRSTLPRADELPRYFVLKPSGEVNTSARWPGWDGWYFFMVPDDRSLPLKMVRASIMTGLYGLQGIDNYDKLLLRLSTFDAVEHLVLTSTRIAVPGGEEKANYLSHRYLPKGSDLKMRADVLDVTVAGTKLTREGTSERYGRIQGAWPNYQFDFVNPEADIRVSLRCRARDIVWWADIPNVFTYFAAFGDFEGSVTYGRGTHKDSFDLLVDHKETFELKGKGAFEHGFARKPVDYDDYWGTIRAIGAVVPSFRAVRYHYELFVGDGALHGGFMFVRAFGVTFRNRGGLFLDGAYRRIKRVKIEYLKDDDHVGTCRGDQVASFHRKWKVRAETEDGTLEYIGIREWPPASISDNMIYYNFALTGTYKGQAIRGRGYGEYLCM